MRKNILLAAIAGLALTAALTGCSGINSATHPEKTNEIVNNAMQKAQNVIDNVIPTEDKNETVSVDVENNEVKVKQIGIHFRLSNNNNINFSEDTYKEFVKFFNGKSFNVGDKININEIKHTEAENESLEMAARVFTCMNDYDNESHTITIIRPTSYNLSLGTEGLDIYVS